MPVTQQEAINILDRRTTIPGDGFTWEQINEAIDMAISALRPISRKQVEKVWRGCKYCDEEWGTCDPITNRFTMPPRGGIRFCPMCGRPLTDEAVQMVMERLEVLRGETETD
jgi:hypothetical protein